MKRLLLNILLVLLLVDSLAAQEFELQRQELLEEVRAGVRYTQRELGRDALDPRVFDALASVPRHEFVPLEYRSYAYENRPLRIGYGQTISQPYIVAIMTDLLELPAGCKALDIGTGVLGMIGNVLWFVVAGWWLAIAHVFAAILNALTIIGIPFARQHFKLALLSLSPFGKTVVYKS